ncbi:transposase IS200-family protein [Bifidobacterium gallicum DSM 20093 = LMG 11596]|uniref:Transposase IS200-family protein n=3 Tax=Bifidobacterium gallicum TaxID=78342 RepID=A0A087AKP2_9BIFI|nr:transposase IS200-family protein [Bifidobacterium gallicum DSM 20093 = LMG 11596]
MVSLLYTVRMSRRKNMDAVKHNHNITYRCHYHVVWCPKYRRKVITSLDPKLNNPPIPGDPGPVDARLKEIIQDVCKEHDSEILELETMPDHVHLLVDCDPQYGINKLVRLIKGRSSRLLRQEYPSLKRRIPTLWTNSYFVATVGGTPLEIVKQYVENQRNV